MMAMTIGSSLCSHAPAASRRLTTATDHQPIVVAKRQRPHQRTEDIVAIHGSPLGKDTSEATNDGDGIKVVRRGTSAGGATPTSASWLRKLPKYL
jgi:hypothetical protein